MTRTRGTFNRRGERHECRIVDFVAGGSESEAERGIYRCACGIRWAEFEPKKEG